MAIERLQIPNNGKTKTKESARTRKVTHDKEQLAIVGRIYNCVQYDIRGAERPKLNNVDWQRPVCSLPAAKLGDSGDWRLAALRRFSSRRSVTLSCGCWKSWRWQCGAACGVRRLDYTRTCDWQTQCMLRVTENCALLDAMRLRNVKTPELCKYEKIVTSRFLNSIAAITVTVIATTTTATTTTTTIQWHLTYLLLLG